MGTKRKYTINHFKKVVDLVNNLRIPKCTAIRVSGFKSRQSYYTALLTLGLEETIGIREIECDDSEANKTPLSKISFI